MAKVSTEVLTRFAFSGSLNPLTEFNLKTATSLKNLGLMAGAITGAAGLLTKWVGSISQANDAVGQLARTTGVSVEAIGELSFAASQNGSSAQAMQSSLSNLNKNIGQVAAGAGERAKKSFELLGISVRDASGQVKSADVIFEEFRASVQRLGLSGQEVQGLAERMGIDRTMVQTLMLSGEGMSELRQKAIALGRTTTEQSDQMLAYNDTVGSLGMAFDGLKVKLATALIPQLTELAELFTDQIVGAADMVAEVFKVIGVIFEALIRSMIRMAPILIGLAAGFVVMKVATMGFAAALAILSKLAIVAALTALFVVVDDLVTAFQGGDSVIANFYNNLTGGRSIVEDLTKIWNTFAGVVQSVIDYYKSLWEIIQMVAKGVANLGGGVFKFVGNLLGGNDTPQPGTQAMLPPAGATNSRTANIQQAVNIDIRSTDPNAAGLAVDAALQNQLRNAELQAGTSAR